MSTPHDPLDALREPVRPVAPDPAFAARLRERLEALLLDPNLPIDEETPMTDTTTTVRLRPGDLSYTALWTPDVVTAERFYATVLGWETARDHDGRGRQVTNLRTGMGIFGGMGSTLFFAAVVDDAGAAAERVRAAGGTVGDTADMPYGRLIDCRDDQGLQFALHQPPPDDVTTVVQEAAGVGELSFVAVQVPDTDRARAFYGSVLGWEFNPGWYPQSWQVQVGGESPRPAMIGLGQRPDGPVVVPMFTVVDIGAACDTVRATGGTATEPQFAGYGTSAECTDDQGGRFYLVQF